MSKIKLTAFAAFTVNPNSKKASIAFGATGIQLGPDGRRIITMGSVPLHTRKMEVPDDGLTLLYGMRDAIDELKLRRDAAVAAGKEFHYADVDVEVGSVEAGLVNEKNVVGLKFANVRRMTVKLQTIILDAFGGYVEEAGGRLPGEMSTIKQIATRPDLFGKLLAEHPLFKTIDVLAFPVSDNAGQSAPFRQLAYVRPGANILCIEQNTEINEFVLPESMT